MLSDFTAKFQKALDAGAAFPNTIKFDFGGDGKIFVDGLGKKVSNDDAPAQCTVTTTMDNFVAISQGRLDPTLAFMQGKLKVAGDMNVAMKLKPLIDKMQLG